MRQPIRRNTPDIMHHSPSRATISPNKHGKRDNKKGPTTDPQELKAKERNAPDITEKTEDTEVVTETTEITEITETTEITEKTEADKEEEEEITEIELE